MHKSFFKNEMILKTPKCTLMPLALHKIEKYEVCLDAEEEEARRNLQQALQLKIETSISSFFFHLFHPSQGVRKRGRSRYEKC